MFNEMDRAYFLMRADEEDRRAAECLDYAAGAAHRSLATQYRLRADACRSLREEVLLQVG